MKSLQLRPPIRVHPFTGLVIDVDTWATAHDYHRRHQQLHLLSMHGSGVAYGLEVMPTDPPSDSVVVEAGVAIDSQGNVIVLPERQHLSVGSEPGTHHVVLDYVESIPPGGGDQQDTRARVMEDFRLRVLASLPESPTIELARVDLPAGGGAIVGAANPWSPGTHEIDCRFRPRVQSHAPREISVGLLVHGDDKALNGHLLGFQFLMREVRFCGLRPEVVSINGSGVIPPVDLLYVTGQSSSALPAAAVKRIAERVSQGAWLFADPCGGEKAMLDSLTPSLKTWSNGNSPAEAVVLGSRFVFGEPPAGAAGPDEVVWGDRVLMSPRDYGCAWSGRHGDERLSREHVRAAIEFGVNVAYGAGGPFSV